MTYRAPLADFRFLLDSFAPTATGGAPGAWSQDGDVVLAFARFCEETVAPLNRSGDEAGCRFDRGAVAAPLGFADAYARFRDAGWPALAEGEDASSAAVFCMDEILGSANLAFSNYLGPTKRVVHTLELFGDEALKAAWLEPLRAGRFGGTLCLTEPQCGTDLGLVSTRAVPDGDGWRISGAKIFVTSGDHDLASNIVHLVLARIEGAPAGPRGLSLFLVPKLASDGTPNGVACAGIEHKMGIRASATCALQFEAARGALVGTAGAGLKAIFPAMEGERLVIALQCLGLAEHALQSARHYARTRLQGRAAVGSQCPELPADPLIVHADVRRMLLTMRAHVEGCRALLAWTAAHADRARREADPVRRKAAQDFVLLMTPMLKAFVTELGFGVTNLGVQVFGGHGYIRESGVEQFVRDARVTTLYAGANGIQALDLIHRKLPLLPLFVDEVRTVAAGWGDAPEAAAVALALDKLGRGAARLRDSDDPNLAGAVGLDFLHLFGQVALTFAWSHTAVLARRAAPLRDVSASFLQGKAAVAAFYQARLSPEIDRLLASVLAGASTVAAVADDDL